MTDQTTNEQPAPAPEAHPESRQGLLLPILIPLGSFAIIGVVLFGFSRILLSITPHAATAIALIVAVSIMVVAVVVASRQRLSNGSLFSMVGSVAGIAMLAGGVAIVTIGAGEEAGGAPQVVTLTAPKGAAATGFDPTKLSVAANQPIELDFSNQDPGIQHNVVIFSADPAKNPDLEAAVLRHARHRRERDEVPGSAAGPGDVLLPLCRASRDDVRDDRVCGGRRRGRRAHRGCQGACVRHGRDRPAAPGSPRR